MKRNLFLLFFLYSTVYSFGQSKEYAHSLLKTLCSPEMHGRGYYESGDKLAADFIAKEFEKIGLKSFEDDYFQEFEIPVNTINGKVELSINGKKLEAGVDYLIDASCPSIAEALDPIYLSKETLLNVNKFRNELSKTFGKTVVIDKTDFKDATKEELQQINEIIGFFTYFEEIETQGIIEITDDNLTFTASQTTAYRPHIILKKEAVPKKIKSVDLVVESEFIKEYPTQNIIGYLEGEIKDSFICVSAHYDHIGRMGHDIYFPGANDNASGTAMMINLATHYAKPENKPKYSMVFFSFGAEEIGLLGSKHYTEHPLFPLKKIKFLLNLDILGTGDDGIQVVNGKFFKDSFDKLVSLNEEGKYLKQVKIRGERCNSDHCFFYEKGIESFFIYTLGGITHYHNIYDKAETLPLTEFDDLLKLLTDFIGEM